jgi:glutamine amidotransferase-like uncharacterized protein
MKPFKYFMKSSLPVLYFILILSVSCEKDKLDFDTSQLKDICIGLYVDNGATDTDEVKSMLNQLNCTCLSINKDTIISGVLENYDIIMFPGGDMWEYKDHLTETGIQKIRSFVQSGGGYIGICGGSYFAADKIIWRGWAGEPRQYLTISGIGIFPGTADGPIEDYAPSYQDYYCKVSIYKGHPITSDVNDQLDYLYSFGPEYIIDDSTDVVILGKSTAGGKNVIIAGQYENGRVFLTSLHPEFDENRTSWKMIRNAIVWCSENKN